MNSLPCFVDPTFGIRQGLSAPSRKRSHMSDQVNANATNGATALARPLEGVHVLEVGTFLAAPLVGSHLRDLGAKVTAVLRPHSADGAGTEEAWRPQTHAALRSGKNLVTLDLKTAVGASRLKALIHTVDVIVIGARPATALRLGLDAASCHATNPSAVHMSLPAFASEDAEHADSPGWESAILARSGVFSDMGVNRQLTGHPASYSPLPLASAYTSVTASLAIVSALLGRARGTCDAKSIAIECPLASTCLEMLVHNSMTFSRYTQHGHARREKAPSSLLPSEAVPPILPTAPCTLHVRSMHAATSATIASCAAPRPTSRAVNGLCVTAARRSTTTTCSS